MTGIASVRVTPVAFRDPPLLNASGVHQPFALRCVIECETDGGLVGLGESYGSSRHLDPIGEVAGELVGLDPFDLHELRRRVAVGLGELAADEPLRASSFTRRGEEVYGAFEIACLDLQGKIAGEPVSALLGGAVRRRVPYSAYLFYRWAEHPIDPGYEPDDWGAALDPEGIVAQAGRMIERYGFSALKLKGGVFPPEQEIAAVQALGRAFPDRLLRLDPNASWTVPTSIDVGRALAAELEYLEDPTAGIAGMAEVARAVPMPLATNMCVVEARHLPPAVAASAVGVVLADHHFWGGATGSRRLAEICEIFGIGLSMHSNSHLGISLAAMTHLAAATPNLTYACDTHWPWLRGEDVVRSPLTIEQGAIEVPTAPGLGVELDAEALSVLHEQYLRCGIRERDDTGYMRRCVAGYERRMPRW